MKIAFLDRDGTINLDYPDSEWGSIKTPEILNGSIHGIKKLVALGYKIIIVTNQYIINDGFISFEQYESFMTKLIEILNEDDIEVLDTFYCRHSKNENCECMKPKIGMFEQAIMKYVDINVNDSIMIGDSECDKIFAENCNLKFYGVMNGSLKDQLKCYESISDISSEIELMTR